MDVKIKVLIVDITDKHREELIGKSGTLFHTLVENMDELERRMETGEKIAGQVELDSPITVGGYTIDTAVSMSLKLIQLDERPQVDITKLNSLSRRI